MNRPSINVTPLIDVLLVLLIIFMVVSPLKPASFRTKIPAQPKEQSSDATDPKTLVVVVETNGSLRLNNLTGLGTPADTAQLTTKLTEIFAARIANGDVSDQFADGTERPANDRIERAVFVKAPRSLDYGSVANVVDAVKLAGAYPISLQIDHLE
jgi:biopolymer transport protein ExbD